MARRFSNLRPGALVLAFLIALFLWGVAHGQSNIERPFDLPLELAALNDSLVVTEQSVDAVNIRVMGSRAALRNIDATAMRFAIDLSGAKRGQTEIEVPDSPVDLPRGARVVSRSPSRITVQIERKGRKAVTVRPDIMGEPAAGFHLANLRVEPELVRLVGARSEVLRLSEVSTEPVDLTGLEEGIEREVRLFLGSGTVWMEDAQPVRVIVEIEADAPPGGEGGGGAQDEATSSR